MVDPHIGAQGVRDDQANWVRQQVISVRKAHSVMYGTQVTSSRGNGQVRKSATVTSDAVSEGGLPRVG